MMKRDSEKGSYSSPDGSATWEYISVVNCAALIFCSGCIAGWNSPSVGMLTDPSSPRPLSSSDASTLTAMVGLGHAIAPAMTIIMADKLGRKNSLLAIGIPPIISWTMIVASENIWVLFVARFIAGLSYGLMICIPPMYLGEIASTKLRGAIGMVCGIMMNTGLLFMYLIVPYLSVKMTACVCASIATVAVIGVWFIPESPYFLAMVGRFEDAEGALEKLRGKTDVGEELELIKNTVSQRGNLKEELELKGGGEALEATGRPSVIRQLFCVPGNRKALGINFLFTTVLQLGSHVSIMVYGAIIFKEMNTGVGTQTCTLIVATLQLVSNILVVFVIDKLGRKPLVCVSGIVSGLCVLTVGVYFFFMEYMNTDVTPYGLFALCAIFVNTIAINIGLMPLQMVVQSETLSTEIKALATCIIGVGGGIVATFGVKSYLTVTDTWGYGHCVPFFVFAANTWLSTALILKFLPETKGKTLLDIQRDLNA